MAHIVLTEHDPQVLKLLRRLLQQAGHTVMPVPERHRLIALLRESPAPLVVVLTSTALLGSHLTGDASTEAILQSVFFRRVRPSVRLVGHPALMLTACADLLPALLLERLARAQVPVLHKPFECADILAGVAGCVSQLEVSPA